MTKKLKIVLEEPYRRLTIDYLNLVFGRHGDSTDYWNNVLRPLVDEAFPQGLTAAEARLSFDIKGELEAPWLNLLFQRLYKLMGMRFSLSTRYHEER